MLNILHSLMGILIFTCIVWVIGKRSTKLISIIYSIFFQVIFTFILIKAPLIQTILKSIGNVLKVISEATMEGVNFVFGYLSGTNIPFEIKNSTNTFIFALQALPQIIVISSISTLLFHLGIIQKFAKITGFIFKKIFKISDELSLFLSIKIFLGQIDAVLPIKSYISSMNRGEIFLIMTSGMATTSFAIITLYEIILSNTLNNPISHILISSITCVSLSIILSKSIIPIKNTKFENKENTKSEYLNSIEAISSGAFTGMSIVTAIITILIVIVALMHISNKILGVINLDIQTIMGYIMFPISFLMGVSFNEALSTGSVLGVKIAMNEINAMFELSKLQNLSEITKIITAYSIFGFANFSSIGIQIAGLSAIAPSKKSEIIKLAPLALLVSTIVNCMNAAIIGLIYKITNLF